MSAAPATAVPSTVSATLAINDFNFMVSLFDTPPAHGSSRADDFQNLKVPRRFLFSCDFSATPKPNRRVQEGLCGIICISSSHARCPISWLELEPRRRVHLPLGSPLGTRLRLALDRNEAQTNVERQRIFGDLFDDVTDLGAPSSPAPLAHRFAAAGLDRAPKSVTR